MRAVFAFFAILSPLAVLSAQNVRTRDVREIAKDGASAIPRLEQLLTNQDRDVRREVVKQLTEIGGQRSLDPLIQATRDNDPEVQVSAANGLVNFYYPGYVQSGIGGTLKRFGTSIKGKFTDVNDQAIDPFVKVRPEVIAAIGKLATGGGNMDSRANAARALGVLRARPAVDDLVEAAHSKDSNVIYESLVALQKIRDQSAGPKIEFLLHDLDPKVQIAAIETVGLLQDKGALPALKDVMRRRDDSRVQRAALTAVAMLPDESSRPLYAQYLNDKDEKMRAAAAEGFGRLKDPKDLPTLQQAWQSEGKTSPRLSLAFAQVMLGVTDMGEFSPLRFLINNLNSASYSGEAYPFFVELARSEAVRQALYSALPGGTRDEKIGIARILARSGDKQSIPELQKLSNDSDSEVAGEGLRALRTLQAKI